MQVFDVDRVFAAFSTSGGLRQFICINAREFRLTGYVRRLRGDHAEIAFEGEQADADAFYDFLKAQRRAGMYSTVRPIERTRGERRLYDAFEIERNASVMCVKSDHSADGYESRSVTSADRAVLLGSQ